MSIKKLLTQYYSKRSGYEIKLNKFRYNKVLPIIQKKINNAKKIEEIIQMIEDWANICCNQEDQIEITLDEDTFYVCYPNEEIEFYRELFVKAFSSMEHIKIKQEYKNKTYDTGIDCDVYSYEYINS